MSASELRAALEGAIAADFFGDRAAHAAYADYLQEQGDPRGELIQVQLALEDESRGEAERQALRRREGELLAAHEEEWLGPLKETLSKVDSSRHRWERGWITEVFLDCSL